MFLPLYFRGESLRCLAIGRSASLQRKTAILLHTGVKVDQIDWSSINVPTSATTEPTRVSLLHSSDSISSYDLVLISGGPSLFGVRSLIECLRKSGIPFHHCENTAISTFYFPAMAIDGDLIITAGCQSAPFVAAAFIKRAGAVITGWAKWIQSAGKFRRLVHLRTKDRVRREEYYRRYIEAGPFEYAPMPDEKTELAEWLHLLRITKMRRERLPIRDEVAA